MSHSFIIHPFKRHLLRARYFVDQLSTPNRIDIVMEEIKVLCLGITWFGSEKSEVESHVEGKTCFGPRTNRT